MPAQTESYWIASAPDSHFPAQSDDVEADVAVIGAGIVGIVAATLLKDAGKTVALLDARHLVRGATGYTTAKLTSSHNIIYRELAKSFGEQGARLYGAANEAGLRWVGERAERYGIDCGYERRPTFVYTEEPAQVAVLMEEAAAARNAGLPASFTTETDLPFPVAGAVRFEDQAQFHPRRFLLPLAEHLSGDGSHVFAHTAATGFEANDSCVVETTGGRITATEVVIATHMPVFDQGLFFAKAHPYNSYAVAGEIEPSKAPQGMYISTGSSSRSIRSVPADGGRLLLVAGNGHHVGEESDTSTRYTELIGFGREHWGVDDYPYRWSTHDYVSTDKVPLVGRFSRIDNHVYTATGFGKWGMAAGVAAAMIISDEILGHPNPWAPLFDAKRINKSQIKSALVENAKVGAHFVLDRVPRRGSVDALGPGEGTVISSGPRQVAVYRDDSRKLHRMSAVCTHLGCIVAWNSGDRTWDCPCHGSRFSAEGTVVNGPAIKDLKKLD